jgi:hypothetical protein
MTDFGVQLEFTDLSIAHVRFGGQPIISVLAEATSFQQFTRTLVRHFGRNLGGP